ncbi:MAG: hypothetical protein H0Z37_05145 [Firmicutes bacterium]|nr:hypothetical protein [Bacillota bacterium]
MTFRGYRIHIIAAAFAVCLVLGLGVQRVVHSYWVMEPMMRDFRALPGVSGVSLESRGDRADVVLVVETIQEVNDPSRLRSRAESVAQAHLGTRFGRVVFRDRRTGALTEAYHRLHLLVHEAAVTGRLTAMAGQMDRMAPDLGLDDWRLFVDERFIYVYLAAGDGHLYELVPWTRAAAGEGEGGAGTS